MTQTQPNNPLHGITLETCLTQLVERFGWDGLASRININCFKKDPSIKSSLKFLRKTPWARDKVEALYIASFSATSASAGQSGVRSSSSGGASPWDKSLKKLAK